MNNRYLQLISWAMCVLAIVGFFLLSWEDKSQPQVEKTGFSIAKRQIISIANNYKELWLLHGSVSPLDIEEQQVYFSDSGWPYGNSQGLNCQQWFDLLWTKENVVWLDYQQSEMIADTKEHKQCQYSYQHGYYLELEIIGTQFNVSYGLAE